jgi:hypothetical protein
MDEDVTKQCRAPTQLSAIGGVPRMVNGVSTSHHNGIGAYKKTWPLRHSKKPTQVGCVYHYFGIK